MTPFLTRVKNKARAEIARFKARPVDFGDFTSADPLCGEFGFDRGTPIDRYYVREFLAPYQQLVHGTCLEVAEDRYSTWLGGDRISKLEILHLTGEDGDATIIGDLTDLTEVPDATFDTIIATQTLPFIYDLQSAVRELYRLLKPGGTCLATVSGISQISAYDMARWGEFWRFTNLSARRLFSEMFGSDRVEVQSFGNAATATAFLQGVAAEELDPELLDANHPLYQVLIGVKATKQ